MTVKLSKKRAVLDLDFTFNEDQLAEFKHPGMAVFRMVFEDSPELTEVSASMPLSDFEAMGSPEKVTVTIEPGDLLNRERLIGPNKSLVPAGKNTFA